ncbi:MAG TPA: biopolymer transporter ExbD [Flavobacteriales bacterium]|jgi:biopolymer transport protein ExbD|nr:biopolymer transporter ExbD [Flavobacteriales bacterium]
MGLRTRNKVSPNFNMSSMTDIVFLLLIFFMLTSTLVTTNALDLVLPSSNSKSVKKQTVSVSIDKALKHYIDQDEVSVGSMENLIHQRLADAEDKVIVLRVEQGVPIEYAVKVMDIAYQNKYKIVLATKPE